jgi:hypothetical protein
MGRTRALLDLLWRRSDKDRDGDEKQTRESNNSYEMLRHRETKEGNKDRENTEANRKDREAEAEGEIEGKVGKEEVHLLSFIRYEITTHTHTHTHTCAHSF